jgi:hypothetical protein
VTRHFYNNNQNSLFSQLYFEINFNNKYNNASWKQGLLEKKEIEKNKENFALQPPIYR